MIFTLEHTEDSASAASDLKWKWRKGRESVAVNEGGWSNVEEEEPKMVTKKRQSKLSKARFSVGWDKKSLTGSFRQGSFEDENEDWYIPNSRKSFGTKVGIMKTAQSTLNAAGTEKRGSQWEALMRKFSEAHKEECKTVPLDIPRAMRSVKQFPTGSQYEGTWDVLGMSGYGTYTFPNGVVYAGDFEDGMFHGTGELRYPSGDTIRGVWRKGQVTERTLVFDDGLEYSEEDWKYCKMPDRRFTIEYENGLQALGKSYMTAEQPTRQIPEGFYDTGDGFYDPKTKIIYKADDLTAIVRAPCPREQKWILENCRTSIDAPLGPRPELYEEWSEPQLDPPPPPPPAAASRAYKPRKSEMFQDDDHDFGMKDRYERIPFNPWNHDSDSSSTSSHTTDSMAVKFKMSHRFRWQE